MTESTQKWYERVVLRVMKDLETDFEFPRLKSVLSQIKSLNFLNNPLSNGATHEYQNTVLL